MNRFEILAAAALLLMVTRADASGPGYVFDDPHVEPPRCTTLFGLPCHVPQGGPDPFQDGPSPAPTGPTLKDWWETPRPAPRPPAVCTFLTIEPGALYANNVNKPEKECA